MILTSIERNGVGVDGIDIVIARPDGAELTVDYQGLLPCSVGCWGVSLTGAYFDTSGAAASELAALGWDPILSVLTLTSLGSHGGYGMMAAQKVRHAARRPAGSDGERHAVAQAARIQVRRAQRRVAAASQTYESYPLVRSTAPAVDAYGAYKED